MRGLDPRIDQSSREASFKVLDCRVKPGNDEFDVAAPVIIREGG
jgi:hypothetical protein